MSRQARGAATKSAIIDAALALFEERGYEATTMRVIAEKAGVSLGSAYYYFDSKEQLIQGFYDRSAERHRQLLPGRLDGTTGLAERLIIFLDTWIDASTGNRRFAASFFRSAADPKSPLSPFSPESAPARSAAIDLLRVVIEGSDAYIAKTIRSELPELLWLFHMGCVLFWVYDGSDDAAATRLLVRRLAPLIVRAIDLARLPALRGLITDLVGLIDELKLLLAGSNPA